MSSPGNLTAREKDGDWDMLIKIWNDFCVPHCYTGETLLLRAIREMGLEKKTGIRLKAFELDPGFPRGESIDVPACVARKYGCSMPEALEKIEYAASMARAAGIEMKFRSARFCNTRDAHRLLKFTEHEYGNELAIKLNFALFAAYFTENLVLDGENLLKIATAAGLDQNRAQTALKTGEYLQNVLADEREAAERGIYAIPHFDFDGRFAISGAASLAGFREALSKMLAEN